MGVPSGAERHESYDHGEKIHAGPREVQPTGKSFKIPSSITCRIAEGRVGEVRIYYDVLGLMGQLGLGP
jgi:ketosteroid isomerase-like protein